MLNECITALTNKINELHTFKVFPPEYAIAMINKNDYMQLNINEEDYPIIILEYLTCNPKLKYINNSAIQTGYDFPGNIALIVKNSSLTTAREQLFDLTYNKTTGLIRHLYTPPSPKIISENTNIALFIDKVNVQVLNEDMTTRMLYVANVISCRMEIWI